MPRCRLPISWARPMDVGSPPAPSDKLLPPPIGDAPLPGPALAPLAEAGCLDGNKNIVALWRSPGSRGWDHEDKLLVNAAASLIRTPRKLQNKTGTLGTVDHAAASICSGVASAGLSV